MLQNFQKLNIDIKRNRKAAWNEKTKQIEALMRNTWAPRRERRYLFLFAQSGRFSAPLAANKISHARIDVWMTCMWSFEIKKNVGWRLAAFFSASCGLLNPFSLLKRVLTPGVSQARGSRELRSRLSLDLRDSEFCRISGFRISVLDMGSNKT